MMNRNPLRPTTVGDSVIALSRTVWLAGLGAAAMTRDWAERDGGRFFRTLVREGGQVESKAARVIGDRLESSIGQANTLWKRARRTVAGTVKAAAESATTIVRETLPASLSGAAPIRTTARKRRVTKAPARKAAAVKAPRTKAAKRPGTRAKRA